MNIFNSIILGLDQVMVLSFCGLSLPRGSNMDKVVTSLHNNIVESEDFWNFTALTCLLQPIKKIQL